MVGVCPQLVPDIEPQLAAPAADGTAISEATAKPEPINKRLAHIMVALLPVGGFPPACPSQTTLTVCDGCLWDPSCRVLGDIGNASRRVLGPVSLIGVISPPTVFIGRPCGLLCCRFATRSARADSTGAAPGVALLQAGTSWPNVLHSPNA